MHREVLRSAFLAALALAAASAVAAARNFGTPVATNVKFTDSTGQDGTLPFQGTVKGRGLRGIILASGEELAVVGTIAPDGTIAGKLSASDGSPVGTFSGRLDADDKLVGSYVVIDGGGGSIDAPADALKKRQRSSASAPAERGTPDREGKVR